MWLLATKLTKYVATLPCNLSLRACFADINVLQRSVATYTRCDGIFNVHLITSLPRNLPVKNVFKSVYILQNYGHEFVAPLFWPTLYIFPATQVSRISCCVVLVLARSH